jgi:hypothetical protein
MYVCGEGSGCTYSSCGHKALKLKFGGREKVSFTCLLPTTAPPSSHVCVGWDNSWRNGFPPTVFQYLIQLHIARGFVS